MQTYTEWLLSKDKSENTVRRYLSVVNDFKSWLESNGHSLDFTEISALDIRDWKNYLQKEKTNKKGKKVSLSTVANSLESLKTYFRFLEDTGQIKSNPAINIKPPKIQGKKQPKWLKRNQENALLRFIESEESKQKNKWKYTRNLAIVHLMLQAGLRISEVVNLEIEDIEKGFILVKDSKGQKSRYVPMNKDLSTIIKNWVILRDQKEHIETNCLFTSQKGGPLTISGVNNLFETIRKNTSLSFLTPHTLRHTFCHNLASKGVGLHIIADIAGHVDIDTTRLYISSSDEEKNKAVEMLSTGKYEEE